MKNARMFRRIQIVCFATVYLLSACSAERSASQRDQSSATPGTSSGGSPVQQTITDSCAREASSSSETGNLNGVVANLINPAAAIPACLEAVKRRPNDKLAWFRLGRSYHTQLSQDAEPTATVEDMINAYQRASDLGEPRAMYALAELRRVPLPGFPADVALADQLLQDAIDGLTVESQAGSAQATFLLGHMKLLPVLLDGAIFPEEYQDYDEGWKMIERASAAGADRFIYNMMEHLHLSDYCIILAPPGTPSYNEYTFGKRQTYCNQLYILLETSKDPLVAYEVGMKDVVRAVYFANRAADTAEQDSFEVLFRSARDYRDNAVPKLEYAAATGDPALAEAARIQLEEMLQLNQAIDTLFKRTLYYQQTYGRQERDEALAAMAAAILVGLIVLGSAQGPGGSSTAQNGNMSNSIDSARKYHECSALLAAHGYSMEYVSAGC